MKVFISPAKKMTTGQPGIRNPHYIEECISIANELKAKDAQTLARILEISKPLAELNTQRYADFTQENLEHHGEAALFTYAGDVYQHWQPTQFDHEAIDFIDEHFLIVSALYGLLRPLDRMLPYRLEMKNKVYFKGQLVQKFWHNRLTDQLKEINEPIVLLCSQEYQKALNLTGKHVIEINFKEWRDDQLKTIAVNAKRARGMMAAFISQNQIIEPNDLKGFDSGDYKWSSNHSNERQLTFIK